MQLILPLDFFLSFQPLITVALDGHLLEGPPHTGFRPLFIDFTLLFLCYKKGMEEFSFSRD